MLPVPLTDGLGLKQRYIIFNWVNSSQSNGVIKSLLSSGTLWTSTTFGSSVTPSQASAWTWPWPRAASSSRLMENFLSSKRSRTARIREKASSSTLTSCPGLSKLQIFSFLAKQFFVPSKQLTSQPTTTYKTRDKVWLTICSYMRQVEKREPEVCTHNDTFSLSLQNCNLTLIKPLYCLFIVLGFKTSDCNYFALKTTNK